jgi:hypothetical protein
MEAMKALILGLTIFVTAQAAFAQAISNNNPAATCRVLVDNTSRQAILQGFDENGARTNLRIRDLFDSIVTEASDEPASDYLFQTFMSGKTPSVTTVNDQGEAKIVSFRTTPVQAGLPDPACGNSLNSYACRDRQYKNQHHLHSGLDSAITVSTASSPEWIAWLQAVGARMHCDDLSQLVDGSSPLASAAPVRQPDPVPVTPRARTQQAARPAAPVPLRPQAGAAPVPERASPAPRAPRGSVTRTPLAPAQADVSGNGTEGDIGEHDLEGPVETVRPAAARR